MKVSKFDGSLFQKLDDYLWHDPVLHAYLIHDLWKEKENSEFFLALSDSEIKGVILIYNGVYPSIWLFGEEEAADELLDEIDVDRAIFIVPEHLESSVQDRYPEVESYPLDVMVLEKGEEILFLENSVRKLDLEDLEEIVELQAKGRPKGPSEYEKEVKIKLSRDSVFFYGFFESDELVSMCHGEILAGGVADIRGVFTHPEYRGRGYANSCLSGCLKRAFEEVERAILLVRSDNEPAKRVYKKVGFSDYQTARWIDWGVGRTP